MMPDWFSLGVMMYRLMMRKSPFDPEGNEWTPKPEWLKTKKNEKNYVAC